MMNLSRRATLILTLLVGGLLFGAYRYSQTLSTAGILQQWFDLSAVTQFALISDEHRPQLAVVDLRQRAQIGVLPVQMPVRVWAWEKNTAQLAYSDGGRGVVVHDLRRHSERRWDFPDAVQKILFPTYGELLVVGQTSVTRLDLSTGQREHFPLAATIRAAVWSALTHRLWLVREDARSPAQLLALAPRTGQITTTVLPPTWHDLGALAISPRGDFLLFGVRERTGFWALLWDTTTATVRGQWRIAEPLRQPYIDHNGQYAVALTGAGTGWLIRPSTATARAMTTNSPLAAYATVWLDKRLVTVGEKIQLFDLPEMTLRRERALTPPATTLFVRGDSKSLLLGSDEAVLRLYDAQNFTAQRLPLTGIDAARQILMGASNTLCH